MYAIATREGMKLFETIEDYNAWYEQGTNRWKLLGNLEEIEPITVEVAAPTPEPIRLRFTVYAAVDNETGAIILSEDEDEVFNLTGKEPETQYTINFEG